MYVEVVVVGDLDVHLGRLGVGGGGGGKGDIATAGGKNASALDDALQAAAQASSKIV